MATGSDEDWVLFNEQTIVEENLAVLLGSTDEELREMVQEDLRNGVYRMLWLDCDPVEWIVISNSWNTQQKAVEIGRRLTTWREVPW